MSDNDLALDNLCWHDSRSSEYLPNDEVTPHDHCFCDPCYHGRNKLALEILRLRALVSEDRNARIRALLDAAGACAFVPLGARGPDHVVLLVDATQFHALEVAFHELAKSEVQA